MYRLIFTACLVLVTKLSFAANPKISAAAGKVYSIATIEIPVDVPLEGASSPLNVLDDEGRILFPISSDVRVRVARPSERPVPRPGNGRLIGRLGNLIREITGRRRDESVTIARRVTFLIRGAAPLQIRLLDSQLEVGRYEIQPRQDQVVYQQLSQQWWTTYSDAAKRQMDLGDYPPWVENYLVAMLGGRLGVALPQWFTDGEENDDPLIGTFKLLAGTESIAETFFRRAVAGDFDNSPAARPLPAGPIWKANTYPQLPGEPDIEPLASRVPPECCYIRYGDFTNFLWFKDLIDEFGGDISRMVTLRGIDEQTTARLEYQLALTFNQLTRMLGPTIIEDQALVATDLFLSEGASIGVVMKAKNAFLLRTTVNADRAKRASADPTVTLANVKIGDQTASLLSSGDNSIRCFMAESDGYFFFSNSEYLVGRFFEVSAGKPSLASTKGFKLARQLMPLERKDTIFAYLPSEMLRGLVAPKYMIEMRRRLHAKSDIALLQLARLAAGAHGLPSTGIQELIESGFLPEGFGARSDGSGVVEVGTDSVDTLRGARGYFLPIADIEIDQVNQQESNWYSKIAKEYSERFSQIDSIMVGLQRIPMENGIEQISLHAEIAPLTPKKFGWIAEQLAPPTRVSMKFAPDDIVAVQAHVESEQIGPATHLFLAVKDTVPPQPDEFDGVINTFRSIKELPAYLGAWPRPGAIDRLPLGLGRGRRMGDGVSKLLGGIYRYADESYGVLSFYPDILQRTINNLEAVDVETPANVRVRIGNLTGSKLQGWINQQLYTQAAKGSLAGANFLNMMTRQLRVLPSQALQRAESILGGRLQCPLGGQFQFNEPTGLWVSTAWQAPSPPAAPPQNYLSPLLTWFRGAQATLAQYSDRLVIDATVNVQRKQ